MPQRCHAIHGRPAAKRRTALAAALLLGGCVTTEAPAPQVAVQPPPAPPPRSVDLAAGPATVVDGHTLEVGELRVRLQAIEAPDPRELRGRRALIELRRIVGKEAVRCELVELERGAAGARQSWIGVCFAGEADIGREMVRRGWARVLPRYAETYVIDESAARAAGRGMWAQKKPAPAPIRPPPRPPATRTT
ncbi:MAG: thermonuclease family protein [Alphaproteobacteria bacterium]